MTAWPTEAEKLRILNQITAAAKIYKEELVGKTFLYYFEGQYIEVMFRKKDFAHLTGVEWAIPSTEVYKRANKRELSTGQIMFSARHPYSLCVRKLLHLSQITKLTSSEIFILKDVRTQTAMFKFGITELNCTVCLDYDLDNTGMPKSSALIIKSLRDEDGFNRAAGAFEVNMIFSKANDAKLYDSRTFNDGKYSIDSLPENIKQKLSDSLLESKQKINVQRKY